MRLGAVIGVAERRLVAGISTWFGVEWAMDRRSRLDVGFAAGSEARFAVAGGDPAMRTNGVAGWRQWKCGHELSIPSGDGAWRGAQPVAKVSMTIMRPPQQGQG